ncbi:cellulose-binding domain-containing protein [Thalassomonas actiniarum]|uniref:Glucosylceramidase n=1 Tax=Thalassomonas actiniarum TaxID=485447 RepID=A0AAF0C2B8_9GAMM|nr:cellulose-binding domain-containing protein [Thalassomonas actiniarum]WDD97599.1 hypothetical protein SG35_020100 [Thalassomonas actiniarum]
MVNCTLLSSLKRLAVISALAPMISQAQPVSVLETRGDKSVLLQQTEITFSQELDNTSSPNLITVNDEQSYQSIDGLGFALTQASALAISMLPTAKQDALLNELFHPVTGNGISLLRVTLGASDLSASLYSYNEAVTSDNAFTPDPGKHYYINLPAHNVRLGASGYSEDAYTGDNAASGEDFQWQFVPSGDGYWYIDRAAGGPLARLRTDDTNMADMHDSATGTWEKWQLTPGEIPGSYFLSLPLKGAGNHDRLQVDEDKLVRMVDNDQSAGTWESFTFTEVTDPSSFSLAGPDLDTLIPILKKIRTINPEIKLLASPWSAPRWMKTNNHWIGGRLKNDHYGDLAHYFKNYLDAMAAQGLDIWALTVQNEPENGHNEPSMLMSADEQYNFIENHLGPLLKNSPHSQVKILGFDHNCDNTSFPIQVAQSQYVDGSAFHLYGGDISAMSTVKESSGKDVYFTEQWTGLPDGTSEEELNTAFNLDLGWHMENVVIGATRNWSKTVLEWNLFTSPSNAQRGCINCMGAMTLDESNFNINRNVSYYIISQLAKALQPGAKRIDSGGISGELHHSAFKNPDNSYVLLAYNASWTQVQNTTVAWRGQAFQYPIPPRSAATFSWTETGTGNSVSCDGVNDYPNWLRKDFPQGDYSHNDTGDHMTYQGNLYQSNWYTNSQPGSDASWTLLGVCH